MIFDNFHPSGTLKMAKS